MHLKALELLLFGFPEDIKLLDHFFRSYQKNYTFDVVGISEVEEPSTSEYFEEQYRDRGDFSQKAKLIFKKRLRRDLLPVCGRDLGQGRPTGGGRVGDVAADATGEGKQGGISGEKEREWGLS